MIEPPTTADQTERPSPGIRIVLGARFPCRAPDEQRCPNCGAVLARDGWAVPGRGQTECCQRPAPYPPTTTGDE